MTPAERQAGMTVDSIIGAVAAEFGVSARAILGRGCTGDRLVARHAVMYVAATRTTIPLAFIGACLGGRDHTTVMNGMERTAWRVDVDPGLAEKIDNVERRLVVARRAA